MAAVAAWQSELETAADEAQADGALDRREPPEQIAFELNAYLLLANAQYIATADPTALDRARHGVDRLLRAASER